MASKIEIAPYVWDRSYANIRSERGCQHDAGLCASARAPWMDGSDRIILRSSEIVGYEGGYFYDDHLPGPAEPEGRGKEYKHIPFQWDSAGAPEALKVNCDVPGKGMFRISLEAREDFIDIELGLRSDLEDPAGEIDWHFCVVAYESRTIGDPQLERTYLFDGERLRSLRDLTGSSNTEMYSVAGDNGFVPPNQMGIKRGSVEAQASVVIVQSVDGQHSVAVGFEQSYAIFSSRHNMCFHAEPYLGVIACQGEERSVRGKLYMIEGDAPAALTRYREEFGVTARESGG